MKEYDEINNYRQKLELINHNQSIDLMKFLVKDSLTYTKFEKTNLGKFSPNTMSFEISFPYKTKEVFFESGKLMYISSLLLKKLSINTFKHSITQVPQIKSLVPLMSIVKEGDTISLLENKKRIYQGIVDKITYIRTNQSITIEVSTKDRTNTLYELVYLTSVIFRDMYLNNNDDKSNSLMYQIVYLLGFRGNQIDIDNMKDTNGEYIKIPFVYLKRGTLIIQDLAQACRLNNSIFTIKDNKFTVRSNENRYTESYRLDRRNILTNLSFSKYISDYKKLKIVYDNYLKKEKQDMWALVGKGGNLENANVKILAGDTRTFKIEWFYNVDLVSNLKVYDTKFEDKDTNPIYFRYELNVDERGGHVTFENYSSFDIYIKSFKIQGIPLFMEKGNTTYFPGEVKSEKVLELTNKYVQSLELSRIFSKLAYHEKCIARRKFVIQTNIAHFLEIGSRIWFEHEDFEGYLIIEKINYSGNVFEVEGREEITIFDLEDIKEK